MVILMNTVRVAVEALMMTRLMSGLTVARVTMTMMRVLVVLFGRAVSVLVATKQVLSSGIQM